MISEWLNGRLGGLRTGLWRHPDFVKLWAGETISVFGSLIGRTALHFTAILVLDARPFEVAALLALGIVPELIFAPFVGVWVDRLRRRPMMIAADLGRATLLASIPLAYAFDALTIEQLYVVAFLTGILSICFEVAYQSYLPSLIKREELLEGNSKLKASDSAAEVGAFGAAAPEEERTGMLREAKEGIQTILGNPFLRTTIVSECLNHFAFGMFGAAF